MRKLIDFLGFLFNKFFLLLLALFIGIFIPLMAISAVLTDRTQIKAILRESNVFTTIPENILYLIPYQDEKSSQDSGNPMPASVENQPEMNQFESQDKNNSKQLSIYEALEQNKFIDPAKLVDAITTIITSNFLEEQSGSLVSGVYNYADGTSENLEFSVSLTSRAGEINTVMKEFISTSLSNLPACSEEESKQMEQRQVEGHNNQSEKFDVLSLSCAPANVDINAEIGRLIDELTTNDGALSRTYTQEDFDLSGFDLSLVRFGYKMLNTIKIIGWLFILGFGVIVIMTAKNLHVGLKHVGANYIASGLMFSGIFIFIIGSLDIVSNAVQNNQELTNAQQLATLRIAEPLYDTLLNHIGKQAIILSVILIIIGMILYTLGRLAKKHNFDHLRLHHYPQNKPAPTNVPSPTSLPQANQSQQNPYPAPQSTHDRR